MAQRQNERARAQRHRRLHRARNHGLRALERAPGRKARVDAPPVDAPRAPALPPSPPPVEIDLERALQLDVDLLPDGESRGSRRGSRRSRRERRRDKLRRRGRSPKPRLSVLVVLSAAVTALFYGICSPQSTPFNYYLSIVWSVYLPLVVVGSLGALFTRHHHRRRTPGASRRAPLRAAPFVPRSFYPGRTRKLLVVTIPSLVCAENLPALQRVLGSLLHALPSHFARFRIDVIAEAGADTAPLTEWLESVGALGTRARVLQVPKTYATPNGARFKTRANHYALEVRRQVHENTADTFVYHLDDDTGIGPDTAASLAEFIEREPGRYLLAQGVLAFPEELTPSRFCWLADAIRPADDITRFSFFTGVLGTPLGGLHGEHLIVRADVEDEIGWDFADTVIEDAYFAIEFAQRYPHRATTLNSYTYGASPASVRDLVRQRRRWIEGLLRLVMNPRLPLRPKLPIAYSIATWALAPLQFVGLALAISYLTGLDNTSPVAAWIIPVWSICLAWVFWLYLEGLKVNLAASARPRWSLLYKMGLIPFVYVASLVETLGIVLGIVRFVGVGRQRASEVIAKPM